MNLQRHIRAACLAISVVAMASPAIAQETTTYEYDVHGRLKNVSRSGGPSSGVNASYQYDNADNRTNVTVSNSPNGNGDGSQDGASVNQKRFVVVPLNGYSLIFIN